jgi:hypothetical protein
METLTGWPPHVLNALEEWVKEIADDDDTLEFYIGRAVDPDERQSQHGSDDIILIYETDSPDNAIIVEEALIQTYISHPKCSNDADDARGNVSDQWRNFVYVAVWYTGDDT